MANRASILVLAVFINLGSCTDSEKNLDCQFVNVFKDPVSIEYFSKEQAQKDAERSLANDRWILVGGYSTSGVFVLPLHEDGHPFPFDEMDRLVERVPINKIEKSYLTQGLEKNERPGLTSVDDGYSEGRRIDIECYTQDVREYGIEFNRYILSGLDIDE